MAKNFLNPKNFYEIQFSKTQIIVFIFCLAINVFIDWISIAQTQTFFSISQKVASFKKALLLIASDLILTINLFTLVYASVFALMLAYDDQQGSQIKTKSYVSIEKHEAEDINERIDISPLRSEEIYDFSYSFQIKDEPSGREDTSMLRFFANSPNLVISDILEILLDKASYQVLDYRSLVTKESLYRQALHNSLDKKNNNLKVEDVISNVQRGSEKWASLRDDGYKGEYEELVILTKPWASKIDWNLAYTSSYILVDNVQDSFPNSISSRLELITYNEIYRNYIYSKMIYDPRATDVSIIYACKLDGHGWYRSTFENFSNYPCSKRVAIEAVTAQIFVTDIETMSAKLRGSKAPLNTLFMTSLLSTIFLYLTTLLLFSSTIIKRYFFNTVNKAEQIYMKGPLAFSGLVVGLIIYIITLPF